MKSWKDIKLKNYIELYAVDKTIDEVTSTIQQLSILMDKDEEVIGSMPLTELFKSMDEWSFLSTPPKGKEMKTIKVNGNRYGLTQLDKLSTGQIIDIEEYYGMGLENNLHNIMACLYLNITNYNPITKSYKLVPYNQDDFKARAQNMLDVDMFTIYSQLLFFWTIAQVYIEDSLHSSLKENLEKLRTLSLEE